MRKCALEEDCEKLSSSHTAVPHAIPIISDDPNDQDRKRWPAIKPAWPTQTVSRRIYIYIYIVDTYYNIHTYILYKRVLPPETNFETAETQRDIKQ